MRRGAAAFITSLAVFAQPAGGQEFRSMPGSHPTSASDDHRQRTWSLARDIGSTGNQISFNQGAEGVWYFMASPTTEHKPQLYRFIREFNAPALPASGIDIPEGFSCWQEPGDIFPDVCFNFTDHPLLLENFEVPPRTLDMHPGPQRSSIVAWRSPVNGAVTIRGAFGDLDANCGNGILWSIDKAEQTLLSGDLANGTAQRFHLRDVRIRTNDVLYFIIDAKDFEHSCDSTALNLTISYGVEKEERR